MKRTIYLSLILLITMISMKSFAQFKDYSFKLGIQGHYVIPANEYSEEKYNPSILIRPHFGFQLSQVFDLGVGIGYGWMQGEDYTNDKYKTTFVPLDLRLMVSPIKSDVVNPYLYIGVGGALWNVSDKPANPINPPSDDNGITGLGELGLGVEIALSQNWVLDISGGANMFTTDDFNFHSTNINDDFLHQYDRYQNIGLGITYVASSCHTDEDNDGIDKCEEELLGTDPMNADTDGDGLKDGDEVNTYKTNPLKADTDGDGLNDGAEVNEIKSDPNKADTDGDGLKDGEEVNTYKTDPLNADTDNDGLKDGEEVTNYKTDPLKTDTDGDGLNDGAEVTNYKTDPLKADSDGDGLKDGQEVNTYKTNPLDPDTDKGTVKDGAEVNRGTNPLDASDDVTKKVEVGEAWNLQGINFATGSAEIMPPYTGTLDSAYTALKANPDWLVEIQGHTDSDGSTKFNQGLSEKRAESVKSFLTGKGIDPARISTKGFGESKPIASNKTKAGKAKNRRIEFVRTK